MAKKKQTVQDDTHSLPQNAAEQPAPPAADSASPADQASLDMFMQKLVDAFAPVPAPGDGRAEAPDTTEDETPAAVVSSISHTTRVLDEETAAPSAEPASKPEPTTASAAEPEKEAAPAAAPSPAEPEGKDHPNPMTEEERAAIRRDNAEFSMIDEAKDNPYRNVFVDSLDRVTADDLGAPPKKKKKDPVDVVIELFRGAIFWAAVVAFFVSGYQIVAKLYSYHQSEQIYNFEDIFNTENRREDLVAMATRSNRLTALTPVNGEREESAELGNMQENYEINEKLLIIQGALQLHRISNKEIVGWIEMPGDTEINYPVVQHEDNDYYLHYAYNGAYNPAGSIYLDYRNQVNVSSNRHTIIYGHNMESGTPMFANLLHFKDESYWKNNRYINIYTDDGMYVYEVFAAYETDPQQAGVEHHSWRMNFNRDDDTFLAWIDALRARSDISPKVPVEADDRILTLSTCMNINENRYVVHAVLVEVDRE